MGVESKRCFEICFTKINVNIYFEALGFFVKLFFLGLFLQVFLIYVYILSLFIAFRLRFGYYFYIVYNCDG